MGFFSNLKRRITNIPATKDFGILLLQTETTNFILREQVANLDEQIQILLEENAELRRQLAYIMTNMKMEKV